MPTPIEMPKLGNTVEECLLARWIKRVGDPVAEGEMVAEIETDKATFELASPASGTLLAAFFNEGDLVPVFTNVGVVGAPGEDVTPYGGADASVCHPGGADASVCRPGGADASVCRPGGADASVCRPETGTSSLTASERAVSPHPDSASLSPRARRFAAEHGFFPAPVAGSGPGGRVLEADLKRLYFESPRPTPLARQLLENGYELRTGEAGLVRASELRPPAEKMSRARATTARRMRESLGSTAQYTLNASAEATGLLNLRARVKERGAALGLPDININEMVMFCAVRALALAPEVNVEFTDGKISRPDGIHLGFACDTPKGLLVPVVKDAGALTLAGLARRIKELTRQAVEGVLPPDDMTGGTFTVSNLGVYGVESFTPILNPPQAAILGVNSIGLKPVRREGAVVFVEHIGLSLTCDHQVIDGAPGARFLKICREQIEDVEAIAGLEI